MPNIIKNIPLTKEISCYAEELSDALSYCDDLNDSKDALARFLEASINDLKTKIIFWEMAILKYTRVFTTGVRNKSLKKKLLDVAEGVCKDTHKGLREYRDKHLAHSVNDFEHCYGTLMVHPPQSEVSDVYRFGIMNAATKLTVPYTKDDLPKEIIDDFESKGIEVGQEVKIFECLINECIKCIHIEIENIKERIKDDLKKKFSPQQLYNIEQTAPVVGTNASKSRKLKK